MARKIASNQIYNADCVAFMATMPENSVDAICTDPPYELNFMGSNWDNAGVSFDPKTWLACLRVLKPGGHMLAFGGSRTYHRIACAIEDAGFEIRDQMQWIYGSGFPKSLNVSKAIDKAAGAEREVIGPSKYANRGAISATGSNDGWKRPSHKKHIGRNTTAPATPDAQQWDGWGTALKPAHEPIAVARKPLSEKTVAANVLKWGTGAINVDGCRIEARDKDALQKNWDRVQSKSQGIASVGLKAVDLSVNKPTGRWPANVMHDGSNEVLGLFPDTKSTVWKGGSGGSGLYKGKFGDGVVGGFSDQGSAARFFYCPKASKQERKPHFGVKNNHPTVKPIALMQYLIRLITPPDGVVLDPFMGSGTTCLAADRERIKFIGIELNKEYFDIARARI
jgi:hypothetical protein